MTAHPNNQEKNPEQKKTASEEKTEEINNTNINEDLNFGLKSVGKQSDINQPAMFIEDAGDENLENFKDGEAERQEVNLAELNPVNQGTVQELPDDGYDGSWNEVTSVARDLGLSGDPFYNSERKPDTDTVTDHSFTTVNYFPSAPHIDFFPPESFLRTSNFTTLEGNLFEQGADGGLDGLASMDINGVGQGYQKSYIPGGIVITTPEGNTLTLYTQDQPASDIRMGDYVYTLNGPMMHNPGALQVMDVVHPETGETVQIYIDPFTYTITDRNGDSVTGKILAKIIDDEPSALDMAPAPIDEANIAISDSPPGGTNQSSVSAEISGSLIDLVDNYFGADGGEVTKIEIEGGTTDYTDPDYITVTTLEGNTLSVNRATGAYIYTLSNPIDNSNQTDHPNATDEQALEIFEFEFTDNDGDRANAELTITIIDDEPVAADIDGGSLDEASLANGTAPDGTALTQEGSLIDGIENQFGADGGEVTKIEIEGGTTDYTDPDYITVTTFEGNTLSVNRATGTYIYTLSNPIDNSNQTDHPNATDGQALEIFEFEFTDGDGDKANAELTVTIVDDAPVATDIIATPLDEANLGNGPLIVTGFIINDIDNQFGADGGLITSITIDDQQSSIIDNGMITVTTADGNVLIVNQTNGEYTYTLSHAINHFNHKYSNGIVANETFSYTLTDSDGDQATASLIIGVTDDTPFANNITMGTVYEAHLNDGSNPSSGSLLLTGNLLNDAGFGADGGSISEISIVNGSGSSVDQGNLIVVTTIEGNVLTVNRSTGAYTYTLNSAVQHAQGAGNNEYNEIFEYVITDNDGDSAQANLNVTIIDDVPAAHDINGGTFDQANLPGHSDPSGTVLEQSGYLFDDHPDNHAGADGAVVASITYQGNEYTAVNGTITVTTAEGNELMVNANTGYYTYTFTEAIDHNNHSEINGDGFAVDRFTYQFRDNDGDTASADLTILIEPDIIPPVANPDTFEFATELGAINLVLALDYSDSMNSMSGYRITALKNFVAGAGGLIDTYAGVSSEITITVILFNYYIVYNQTFSDATIGAAKNLITSTNASGGTDFINPMQAAYDALENPPSDARNIFYFVTDGTGALTPNQDFYNNWYDLLDQKNIDSVVVSIGTDILPDQLEPIANPEDDPKIRSTDGALTNIGDILLSDTQQIEGNILSDDDPGNGDTPVVSAFSQNGNDGTIGAAFTTANGAKITVNADGSFTYEATLDLLRDAYSETFSYTIENSAGTSTSTFTINVTGAAPVIIDMDGDGVIDVSSISEGIMYDIDGDGTNEQTSWVGPNDGILVFDFQGDGKITDAKEFVFTMWDETAQTDMEALRNVFDTNGDGALTSEDEGWAQFGIWQDKNGDGISDEGEFFTLDELGFERLDLLTNEEMEYLNASTSHGVSQLHHKDGYSLGAHDVSLKYVDVIVEEPLFENESAPQNNANHSNSSELPPLANDNDFSAPNPENNLAHDLEMQSQNGESLG